MNNLPKKIHSMNENFQTNILSKKELKKVARALISKHTPDTFDLLNYYNIPLTEIKKGVICPQFSRYPMIRRSANWHCINCCCKSKTAHIEALRDYALLIGNTITNKQAREFLVITSDSIARKLLQSMNLRHISTKKGRVYFLD